MSVWDIINGLTSMWRASEGDRAAQRKIVELQRWLMKHWRVR